MYPLLAEKENSMLNKIYLISAIPLTVAVFLIFGELSHWWAFLVYPLAFLAMNLLHVLVILAVWLCLPPKRTPKKPIPICTGMIRVSLEWICSWVNIKVSLIGEESIPDEPCVLVSNHLSDFDPLTLLAAVKTRPVVYICKKEVFKLPVVSRYLRCAGFLPIDRSNALRAARTLQDAGKMMQSLGVNVGIYPEGMRSRTGKLLRFKEGGFVLAQRAEAPIVVLTTKGTELVKKRAPFRRTKVELKVIGLIDKETVARSTPTELANLAHQMIGDALQS